MNIFQRIKAAFARNGASPEAVSEPARLLPEPAPAETVNDAARYGVTVTPAVVAPGGWFWQAVSVRHLPPGENNGRHHIYVDMRDPAVRSDEKGKVGARLTGARARVTWEGGEQVVTVEKGTRDGGANVPMWKWQVCALEALGLTGQELPSDRVSGLHTGHPDESTGNTLFHHSFAVTFLKTRSSEKAYSTSAVQGSLRHAAGRSATLYRGETRVAVRPIGIDESFRFAELAAGEYTLSVEGTSFRSSPIRLNGRNEVRLDLTLVVADSVIGGKVRNGQGRAIQLLREGAEVASQQIGTEGVYRFAGLPGGSYRVRIAGTHTASGLLSLDGAKAARVDLVAPSAGRPIDHYLLFGPADESATQAGLLLCQDYLLAFAPAFGFSAGEAAHAGMVTIIGGDGAVSQQVEKDLGADGTPVQRITGTVEQIADALQQRIAKGQAFI